MITVVIALLLAADGGEIKVGAPGLSYVGMSEAQGDVFFDYLTQQLALQGGIRVTTRKDVATILGMERQKALLGCSEGTECMAELAGALGVAAVMTGSLATSGPGYVLNLKVNEASGSNRAIGIYSERVKSEDELFDLLKASARDLAGRLRLAFAPQKAGVSARKLWWIPAAIGVGLLIAGSASFGVAKSHEDRIAAGDASITTQAQLARLERDAPVLQTVGFALGAAGIAALLVSVSFAIFGDAAPALALDLRPDTATFSVFLRWP